VSGLLNFTALWASFGNISTGQFCWLYTMIMSALFNTSSAHKLIRSGV